jgi:hypothetical protein
MPDASFVHGEGRGHSHTAAAHRTEVGQGQTTIPTKGLEALIFLARRPSTVPDQIPTPWMSRIRSGACAGRVRQSAMRWSARGLSPTLVVGANAPA